MSDQQPQWFSVMVDVKVLAADKDDAINRVTGAIRNGVGKGDGKTRLYPVGNFDAWPTADPIEEARSRHRIFHDSISEGGTEGEAPEKNTSDSSSGGVF